MTAVHQGPTLTPHFRDFLPAWVARQPWYAGTGVPVLRPVGSLRLEDPAGEVGIETQIVTVVGDEPAVYQLPMTYRGAPLPDDAGLIAVAEHSELGTRWIYDGPADPVWVAETTRRIGGGAATGREAVPPLVVEVVRRLDAPAGGRGDAPDGGAGALVGVLEGSWQPDGPDAPGRSGILVRLVDRGR